MTLVAETMVGGYGGADILKGVSLSVAPGEMVVVVGPNGAGKSTALKAIFGLVRLRAGRVLFEGDVVSGVSPDGLVRRGLGFVPQTRNVFPNLTVHENFEIGAFPLKRVGRDAFDRIYDLFPALKERRRTPAGQLSGGQRQMVAMGRAMIAQPRMLLLDEPTAGVSPAVVDQIFDRLLAIKGQGIGILMVEQNARQALAIADRGYVLASGENRFEGTGRELVEDPDVAAAFLGG